MLKRKVEKRLLKWKNQKKKKCLIVQGARQTGKTYAITRFGETHYDELVAINFKETPSASEIFAGDLDVESLLLSLRFRYPDKEILPKRTLIFLDEIQECEEAITSLKFWSVDGRFDVIASGSLLGIDYKRASSYPVGYVETIEMYGLDLEEFLWAQGISEEIIERLRGYFRTGRAVPEAIHKEMMRHLRLYAAIGGMPEVVRQYVQTKDFRVVDQTQRDLLQGYLYDIAHYATAEEKLKAEKCFLSLTKQLLDKENHKFQYKEIEKGARAQKYYSSIEWLLRADIVRLCTAVTDCRYDLSDYAREDFFRLYATDLSLLIPMKDFSLKQHIVENTLSGNTKGGLYECVVADLLLKKSYPLYFYKNETTKTELDFLIQREGEIVPIEVKSGNSRATSLKRLIERKELSGGYKLIDGNVGKAEGDIVTLPIYMVMFFDAP